jgi:hypothetical protein
VRADKNSSVNVEGTILRFLYGSRFSQRRFIHASGEVSLDCLLKPSGSRDSETEFKKLFPKNRKTSQNFFQLVF